MFLKCFWNVFWNVLKCFENFEIFWNFWNFWFLGGLFLLWFLNFENFKNFFGIRIPTFGGVCFIQLFNLSGPYSLTCIFGFLGGLFWVWFLSFENFENAVFYCIVLHCILLNQFYSKHIVFHCLTLPNLLKKVNQALILGRLDKMDMCENSVARTNATPI